MGSMETNQQAHDEHNDQSGAVVESSHHSLHSAVQIGAMTAYAESDAMSEVQSVADVGSIGGVESRMPSYYQNAPAPERRSTAISSYYDDEDSISQYSRSEYSQSEYSQSQHTRDSRLPYNDSHDASSMLDRIEEAYERDRNRREIMSAKSTIALTGLSSAAYSAAMGLSESWSKAAKSYRSAANTAVTDSTNGSHALEWSDALPGSTKIPGEKTRRRRELERLIRRRGFIPVLVAILALLALVIFFAHERRRAGMSTHVDVSAGAGRDADDDDGVMFDFAFNSPTMSPAPSAKAGAMMHTVPGDSATDDVLGEDRDVEFGGAKWKVPAGSPTPPPEMLENMVLKEDEATGEVSLEWDLSKFPANSPTPDPAILELAEAQTSDQTDGDSVQTLTQTSVEWNVPAGSPTHEPAILDNVMVKKDEDTGKVSLEWDLAKLPADNPTPDPEILKQAEVVTTIETKDQTEVLQTSAQWNVPAGSPTHEPAILENVVTKKDEVTGEIVLEWDLSKLPANHPTPDPAILEQAEAVETTATVNLDWNVPANEPTPDPEMIVMKEDHTGKVSLEWNLPASSPTPDPAFLEQAIVDVVEPDEGSQVSLQWSSFQSEDRPLAGDKERPLAGGSDENIILEYNTDTPDRLSNYGSISTETASSEFQLNYDTPQRPVEVMLSPTPKPTSKQVEEDGTGKVGISLNLPVPTPAPISAPTTAPTPKPVTAEPISVPVPVPVPVHVPATAVEPVEPIYVPVPVPVPATPVEPVEPIYVPVPVPVPQAEPVVVTQPVKSSQVSYGDTSTATVYRPPQQGSNQVVYGGGNSMFMPMPIDLSQWWTGQFAAPQQTVTGQTAIVAPAPAPVQHNAEYLKHCLAEHSGSKCVMNEDEDLKRADSNEDEAIYEIYYTNPIKCCGVIVEIGAGDGKNNSVSHFFEYGMNWEAINIEANPKDAYKLAENRPDAYNRGGAFCESDFMWHDKNGFHSNDRTEVVSELKSQKDIDTSTATQVECLSLGNVLREKGLTHVDVMVIHASGDPLAVLRKMDWTIRVDIWIIKMDPGRYLDQPEANSASIIHDETARSVLLRNEYVQAEWDIRRWCGPTAGHCKKNEVFLRKNFNPLPGTVRNLERSLRGRI